MVDTYRDIPRKLSSNKKHYQTTRRAQEAKPILIILSYISLSLERDITYWGGYNKYQQSKFWRKKKKKYSNHCKPHISRYKVGLEGMITA